MKQRKKNNPFYSSFIKVLLFVWFVSYSIENLNGQVWKLRRYEIGVGIGNTQIFGDIGGTMSPENWMGLKDIQLTETRPSINFVARYKINNRAAVRANFITGFGYGSDETSGLLRQREYNTVLMELSSSMETYFIQELRPYRSHAGYRRLGMVNNYKMFAFYGFLGGGVAYAHSKTSIPIPSPKVDKTDPNNFIPVFPIGLGIKYIIDDVWILDANLGYRYALSDFLDGYTQIEKSQFNDVYYILSLSIVHRLRTTKRNIPAIFDKEYKAQFK